MSRRSTRRRTPRSKAQVGSLSAAIILGSAAFTNPAAAGVPSIQQNISERPRRGTAVRSCRLISGRIDANGVIDTPPPSRGYSRFVRLIDKPGSRRDGRWRISLPLGAPLLALSVVACGQQQPISIRDEEHAAWRAPGPVLVAQRSAALYRGAAEREVGLGGMPGSPLASNQTSLGGIQLPDGRLVYSAGDAIFDELGRTGVRSSIRVHDGVRDQRLLDNAYTLAALPDGDIVTVEVLETAMMEPGVFNGHLKGQIVSLGGDREEKVIWSDPGEWFVIATADSGGLIAGQGREGREGPQSLWWFPEPRRSVQIAASARFLAAVDDRILAVVDEDTEARLVEFELPQMRSRTLTTTPVQPAHISRGVADQRQYLLGWSTTQESGFLAIDRDTLKSKSTALGRVTYEPYDLQFHRDGSSFTALAAEPTASDAHPHRGPNQQVTITPGRILVVRCTTERLTCKSTPTELRNDGLVRMAMTMRSQK